MQIQCGRVLTLGLIVAVIFSCAIATAQEADVEGVDVQEVDVEESYDRALDWPREVEHPKGTIIVYEPQATGFEGNRFEAVAAVSVTRAGEEEPAAYGAVWAQARVETNRDERTARLFDLKVTRVEFAEATEEQKGLLGDVIEKSFAGADLTLSIDQFLTILSTAETEELAAAQLGTEPPKIVFRQSPSVLVTIDGEPVVRTLENTELRYVVNTPFFLAQAPETRQYYLHASETWYLGPSLEGPWQVTRELPTSITRFVGLDRHSAAADSKPPEIVTATEPTALIVTDGWPDYRPTGDGDLAYIDNTQSDVFRDNASDRYYALLSGRWFTASALEGPWTYVPSEDLPESFKAIPADSPKGHVLSHVAGTDEAYEAALETHIPQTAVVKRSDASLEVEYDGTPRFEQVETVSVEEEAAESGETAAWGRSGIRAAAGQFRAMLAGYGTSAGTEPLETAQVGSAPTSAYDIAYAVNCSTQVLRIDRMYYACHEGVWFVADHPTGPWSLADSVPREALNSIAPTSPVYNVKYVYVYDSTPDVVYVGYTPGYEGSYAYGYAVVYGTGYRYRAWRRTWYYPRAVTYGYRAVYDPWTGAWGYRWGLGWRRGTYAGANAFRWDTRWGARTYRRGGWWGVGGYRDAGIGRRGGIAVPAGHHNVYGRTPGRGVGSPARMGLPSRTRPASGLRNNVYADARGNIHRRTAGGWQTRGRGGWGGARANAPRTPSRGRYGTHGYGGRTGLARTHYARQRGSYRTAGHASRRGGGVRRGRR